MKQKDGFTLIEVLIATAIMVSVLGALVYGLSQSSNLVETTRNQDIAFNAAQDKLEEIAHHIDRIATYDNQDFPIEDVAGNDLLTAPANQAEAGVVTVTDVVAGELYDVAVTVTWIQRGGRQISRILTTTLVRK